MGQPDSFTNKEFAALMVGLQLSHANGPFAVAVSGGPDSMALALLVAGWGDAAYLTFDHGLRKESAGEAKQVGDWLSAKGLKHHILTWKGDKPASDIQAAARAARYRALETWCMENGVKYLLLGHTLDDQAETFLIRLFRGSGVDGLSAMAAISPPNTLTDGPKLVRPLLPVKKESLVQYLETENQGWIEDPSNENLEFTRIQIRKLLAETDIEGFDPETLAKTAARMARVKRVLDRQTGEILGESMKLFPEGYARLDTKHLFGAEEEIGLRALSKTLMMIGGAQYPQRLASLERLYAALKEKDFKGATLTGCQILPEKDGQILVCREPADITHELPLEARQSALWDNRFLVSIESKASESGIGESGDGVVKKLGEAGWNSLLTENPALKELTLPYPVKIGLPALVTGNAVREVPGLGFFAGKPAFTARFIHLTEKGSEPVVKPG